MPKSAKADNGVPTGYVLFYNWYPIPTSKHLALNLFTICHLCSLFSVMFHVAGNRETIKDLKTSISKKNMKKNGRKRKLFNSISKGRKHKFVQGANRARTATEIVTPIVYSDSLNLSTPISTPSQPSTAVLRLQLLPVASFLSCLVHWLG